MKTLEEKIMEVCENHNIRLTPKEFKELVDNYIDKFINHVSITDLIRLSEYIVRRNG